ncbi:peptidyl-tRNA hydrolase, mitochondrial isoform X1 [Nicotiana tabacum]|uniref:Peptidyl-tRNA hydrolase, mitochondrial isoform X1 n=2 Tax=Nicotiana tabacum TaxID=4097 RepID=A0AC58TJA8_TOBAC
MILTDYFAKIVYIRHLSQNPGFVEKALKLKSTPLFCAGISLRKITEMLSRIYRRNFCTCSPRPWLFVGLGNPGEKYKGTRHNVGFEMLDAFAESQGIQMETVHCKAMFGKGFVNGVPVLLAKPLTYMNLSGESTGSLAAYYKLPLNRVVVFHDDMDLPCGVLRLHPKGGHHSHNGLKSVIYHFRANREFPRLRIGIGRPPGQMDPKAFMLQKFNLTARERIDAALVEGIHALKQVLSKGFSESSKCFNTEQKYKHIRLQTLPT